MPTHCPHCERPFVRIAVPPDLREYAPETDALVDCCPHCLRTYPVGAAVEADPDPEGSDAAALPAAIPDGDGGVALVLALGLLDSLATNRAAIQALVEHAEQAGTDVFLALRRLADDESVDAHVDIERRRRQLESLLE
ncbi:hypothetical protein DVK02_07950 [Halobellus sp. Atlit-31R]|nr:hypothetical protein DVK02_07950 [Halobellus sp. Atlit-31R]